MRLGFGGSERKQTVDLRPAMVGVMSTMLHHKHPSSVSDTLALKLLLLTTFGARGSVERLENQLGAGFSRQTSNALLSNIISDSEKEVLRWTERVEMLWGVDVSRGARRSGAFFDAPSFILACDNVGKVMENA